jgi:hypothetical protein
MSPVSRGRKPKKKKSGTSGRPSGGAPAAVHAGGQRSAMQAMQELLGSRDQPAWFEPSVKNVLDAAETLQAARGPRELDQLTAELVGAELERALRDEREGLRFSSWLAELVAAAAARTQADDRHAFLLLHGLASVATPGIASASLAAVKKAPKNLRNDPALRRFLDPPTATGDVFRMRDAYGTRFGVIATFTHVAAKEEVAYLFDIDASGFVSLAGAGVFDGVDQAAAAWRGTVGDAAADVPLDSVDDAGDLMCLVHCDVGDEFIMGHETREVLDNWFRAQRRIHDLAQVLRKRGTPLPEPMSLYRGIDADIDLMAAEFAAWFTAQHGGPPDADAAEAIADQWIEGALPETWYAVSPQRVEFQLGLISDWIPDDPTTHAAEELLPEWVRWLGERSGQPAAFVERSVAAALSRP